MEILEKAKKDMKTNELLDNVLNIYEIINDATLFVHIKFNIESLDTNTPDYKKIVNQTNTLIKVLNAFSV